MTAAWPNRCDCELAVIPISNVVRTKMPIALYRLVRLRCRRRALLVRSSSWLIIINRFSACLLGLSNSVSRSKRSDKSLTRATTFIRRFDVDRTSMPHAEMRTAGVIMADRTSSADDNWSIRSFPTRLYWPDAQAQRNIGSVAPYEIRRTHIAEET